MFVRFLGAALCGAMLLGLAPIAWALSPQAERVVEETLRDNPDMWELCKGGEDTVRPAITNVVFWRYIRGELGGDPNEIGTEAGYEIGRRCEAKFGAGRAPEK